MLYLDYAKVTPNGYILNFFADKEADLADISNGKRFVTKNGIDYGVPQPSSTVVITMPDKTKKTYVLNEAGEWQEGGVDMDYSKLENAPITLANLADKDFVPEANTYYEHLGETTKDFIKGIIYLYDGKEYKAIDGLGSGGGVQADYNQNDSAAADYIKNRPFYEGIIAVLEQTFTTSVQPIEGEPDLNFWETTDSKIPFIEGETVKVLFNGTEYTETVKKKFGSILYVGNIYIFTREEADNTGEPFAVANTSITALGDGTAIITEQPQTNATIKVEKIGVKKMPAKYLPDGTATETYVDTAVDAAISNAITKTLNTEV